MYRPRVAIPSPTPPPPPPLPPPLNHRQTYYQPESTLTNPWDEWDLEPVPYQHQTYGQPSAVDFPTPHHPAQSSYYTRTSPGPFAFPEPQFYHYNSPTAPPETYQRPGVRERGYSRESVASSYYEEPETPTNGASLPETPVDELAHTMDSMSLDYNERLKLFQKGSLPENEQDWYRLAPPEAREALGEQEVQRQSVLFELCKSEMDYVSDLQAVKDVFVEPLRRAKPPIIQTPERLQTFISDVFGNLDQIVAMHQKMLRALFNRQSDQHPLIQSFADIILDTILKAEFRTAYDTYIKHYPLAESKHRKELLRNPAYQTFMQNAGQDTRIRKRDLVTFLSRPVTRLPRLNLLLETILKRTDKENSHPDLETLPMILGILGDTVKATQPGIEAAEAKVKLWALAESLVYQKGEIVDIDLYDPSRVLVYTGSLARKSRDEWSQWTDLNVALLDNYLLMTRETKHSNGTIKRYLMSRPISLSYLRLGTWDTPAETRKERLDEGGLLDRFRHEHKQVYPFNIAHASDKLVRRYTLYATSEAIREKWRIALLDAVAVHKARQDGNMWFEPKVLANKYFALASRPGGPKVTGKATTAAAFSIKGRKYIAVGCPTGIYVGAHGTSNFTRVLPFNATLIAALQGLEGKVFNRFLLLHEGSLYSYPLDTVVSVHLGEVKQTALLSSQERLATKEGSIIFFRAVKVLDRVLVIYASKRTLQTPSIGVLEVVDNSKLEQGLIPFRSGQVAGSPPSYRAYGESGYAPRSVFDALPLSRKIVIVTENGLMIADPASINKSTVSIVPDLSQSTIDPNVATLKARVDGSIPLGLVRCQGMELLVVYQDMGCYVDKHGRPTRKSGFIKWETPAQAFAYRDSHVLLFSPSFIEIRDINTGRLVQVIEGQEIRLLHCGPKNGLDKTILVAMRHHDDVSQDTVLELTDTSPFNALPSVVEQGVWSEWDVN